MRDRAIRIGTFSGYLGDRFTALAEALDGDPVDVLAGDYLAEITLAMLAARHRRDPARGYVEYFLGQLWPHLATIAERGVKVVTNAAWVSTPPGSPTPSARPPPRPGSRCRSRTSKATTSWPTSTSWPPRTR